MRGFLTIFWAVSIGLWVGPVMAGGTGLLAGPDKPLEAHVAAQRHFEDGNRLLDQRRYTDAIEQYTKAISLNAQFVEAYYNKALACEQREKALGIKAWQEFVSVAEGKPQYKSQVTLIKRHMNYLSAPSPLPASLSMSHYSEKDGDYYPLVIQNSHGQQWNHFPLKVFISASPQKKVDEAIRQAVEEWSAYFPLKLVGSAEEAEIQIQCQEKERPTRMGKIIAGQAGDSLEVEESDQGIAARARSEITVLVYKKDPRPKKEIKAVVLHELGHALGIKGHSDDERDLMYPVQRSRAAIIGTKEGAKRVGKSDATEITLRDANTLIRIYNTDVLITRY